MSRTVYYIDKSVGEELKDRAVTPKEKILFDDLANAYCTGQCYLCGDIGALQELTKQVSEIYSIVAQRYAEAGSVMEAVQKVFILSYAPNASKLPDILQQEGKCRFIPIQTTLDENWQLRECTLIAENLEDCSFYEIVADWYRRQQKMMGISVHFHREGGGGNTIKGALRNCVEKEKRPSLCLVDSDQKYGETKLTCGQLGYGETCRQAETVLRDVTKPNLPPCELCRLDVHEVENLIPTQILQELQRELPDMAAGLDRLKQLQALRNGEPALYYDYKNGFPYIKSEPARAYWQEILSELGGKKENMPGEQKLEKGQYNPHALFFMAISGNKLLERATEKMEEVEWEVDAYLVPFWEQIGAVMLTWGFATSPTYA